MLLHYPGTPNDFSSGKPIDQDDGGPSSYSVSFDAKRQILGTDNFKDALNKTYNLDPLGEKGTIEAEWSGKIKSTYVSFFDGNAYDCMSLSDAPTIKVTVSGKKEDKSDVALPVQGVTLHKNNMGYSIEICARHIYERKKYGADSA